MQVGGLHAHRETYIEGAVECSGIRQIMPSPSTERSHGIAPDYRCTSALVRWRRILGVAVEVIGDEQTLPRSLKYRRISVPATVTHRENWMVFYLLIIDHEIPLTCERPLRADCVEEVGGPTVWDVARNQARVSLFALRPALGRAAGSALPAFGGSGLLQRGGTRLEHRTVLSA
jgi:hypothetical protein